MKFFVTGATGFVGSYFVNAAHAAGHEIVAVRRSAASVPRVPIARQPYWIDGGMDAVEEPQLSGCEVMVHLAAHSANVPYDTLENCLHWNVVVAVRLFERAFNAGIRRFIVAGTCFEYGRSGERYEFIPVDAPLEPTMTYPASKAAATMAFHAFAAQRGVQLLVLRIFQVFGEGELPNRLWPSLREAALAGSDLPMTPAEQVRDFISVEDVAEGFLRAVSRDDLPVGAALIENLGTGRPQTLRAFAEHWWRKWGATGKLQFGEKPYRDGEVMRYVPQIAGPIMTDLK